MNHRHVKKHQFGLGMLEAALIMAILVTVFLSAVGVFDYISKGIFVSHVIDQFIHDQEIKPFELQGATLQFTEQRLRDALPTILSNVERNIQAGFSSDNISNANYVVETEFVAFSIDAASGEALGINHFSSARLRSGSLSIPSEVEERINFDKEYDAMLERGGNQYASPSGLFAANQSTQRFLPQTAVIAVRVAVSLDQTFTGSMLKMLGVSDNPMVYDLRAVTLRGEVG